MLLAILGVVSSQEPGSAIDGADGDDVLALDGRVMDLGDGGEADRGDLDGDAADVGGGQTVLGHYLHHPLTGSLVGSAGRNPLEDHVLDGVPVFHEFWSGVFYAKAAVEETVASFEDTPGPS